MASETATVSPLFQERPPRSKSNCVEVGAGSEGEGFGAEGEDEADSAEQAVRGDGAGGEADLEVERAARAAVVDEADDVDGGGAAGERVGRERAEALLGSWH